MGAKSTTKHEEHAPVFGSWGELLTDSSRWRLDASRAVEDACHRTSAACQRVVAQASEFQFIERYGRGVSQLTNGQRFSACSSMSTASAGKRGSASGNLQRQRASLLTTIFYIIYKGHHSHLPLARCTSTLHLASCLPPHFSLYGRRSDQRQSAHDAKLTLM